MILPHPFYVGPLLLVASTLRFSAALLTLDIHGPAVASSIDELRVTVTLTNTGSEPLRVLRDPLSPLSALPAHTFLISSDARGFQPAFSGVKVKWSTDAAAEARAYTLIQPYESVGVEHDLAEAYDFTRSGEGRYTINARNAFYVVEDDGQVTLTHATVRRRHNTHLTGRLSRPRLNSTSESTESSESLARASTAAKSSAAFIDCTSAQEADIIKAASAAQNYASAALSYLQTHTTASSRFAAWFGEYSSANHETLRSHFAAISGHNISSFKYHCSCTDPGTYAYVWPSSFGEVYLCGAFWRAPIQGTDSKAGTLVHESSHFDINGATEDIVYGQSGCKNLAFYNPSLAVTNADSHEYFAENNPSLM